MPQLRAVEALGPLSSTEGCIARSAPWTHPHESSIPMCTRGNDLAPVPRFNLVSRPPDMTKIYDVIKNTPVELHYWPYKN